MCRTQWKLWEVEFMDWVMEQINKGSYSVLEILENCEGVLKLFGEEGALKSVTDNMRENQTPTKKPFTSC